MTTVSAQLKLDVRVPTEGGIELGAWLFLPEGDGPHPAITMATALPGRRNTVLSVSPGRSPQRVSSCFCMIIAISGRAAGTSPATSIHGDKSQTGVAQFLTLRTDQTLIEPVSASGARAMPADTLLCSALQIGGCAAS